MSTSTVSPVSPGAAGQVSDISLQNFLQILSTQLTNQDPLKPLDDQAFLAQIAQFSTLEQTSQLNSSISQMLTVQSVTQSVGLIGRTVTVNPASGTGSSFSGQVSGLDYVSGTLQLTVKNSASGAQQTGIALSQISSIK